MDPPMWVSVPNTGILWGWGDIMGHGSFTESQVPSEQSATTCRDQRGFQEPRTRYLKVNSEPHTSHPSAVLPSTTAGQTTTLHSSPTATITHSSS